MTYTDNNGFQYYSSLDKVREDGYAPVKVNCLLQYYTLVGRKTVIEKANLVPLKVKYVIETHADGIAQYWLRDFRDYGVDELYFYRRTDTFFGEDEAIESLRRYVDDGRVWLLFTMQDVADMTMMLKRLWKSKLSGEGQVKYTIWVALQREYINLEDYKLWSASLMGFKTVCRQFELRIEALWKQASESLKTN